jgi:hypothetical protein
MKHEYQTEFLSKKYSNVAFALTYQDDVFRLRAVLCRTLLSIDSFEPNFDIVKIVGSINIENHSLCVIQIRSRQFETFISPKDISFDYGNRIFTTKIPKSVLDHLHQPIQIEFSIKKGNVKYGIGDSFTKCDVQKMSSILIKAYEMSLSYFSSILINPRNFLSSGRSSKRPSVPPRDFEIYNSNKPLKSKPLGVRHEMNSPVPNFLLNRLF